MTTKERLERLVLDVCEASSAFCMDNEQERKALADVLTVEVDSLLPKQWRDRECRLAKP